MNMNNMTMAELRAEIELKKTGLEELKTMALDENRKVEEHIKVYLEELLDGCIVRLEDICDTIRVEVGFDSGERYDDGTVRFDFGSTFSIRYEKDYKDKQKKLFINHGISGPFCKDDRYMIARIKAMSKVWGNVDAIEDFMGKIELENNNKYLETSRNIYWLERELDHRERDEKRAIAEKNLAVGKTYVHWGDVNTVYKITEKSVLTTDRWGDKHRFTKSKFISNMMCAKDYGIVVGYQASVYGAIDYEDVILGVYPTFELAHKAAREYCEENEDFIPYWNPKAVTESEVE